MTTKFCLKSLGEVGADDEELLQRQGSWENSFAWTDNLKYLVEQDMETSVTSDIASPLGNRLSQLA